MAYFAELDSNNVVKRVIVADQAFIDSGVVGDPKNWIETFMDNPVLGKCAGVRYTYDRIKDAFVPPKPFPSWVLDEQELNWGPPTPMPRNGKFYTWKEDTKTWIELP